MKVSSLRKQQGFTIIELLIVIVVIGILAGLVLNAFGNIQERARDTERQTDIGGLTTQLEVYYADNGHYPAAADIQSELTEANPDSFEDPAGNLINAAGSDYTYVTTSLCTTAGNDCLEFYLEADLEVDENGDGDLTNDVFRRDSANGTPSGL